MLCILGYLHFQFAQYGRRHRRRLRTNRPTRAEVSNRRRHSFPGGLRIERLQLQLAEKNGAGHWNFNKPLTKIASDALWLGFLTGGQATVGKPYHAPTVKSYVMHAPPSMMMSEPTKYVERSEASRQTMPTISSISPKRLIGTELAHQSTSSCDMSRCAPEIR